MSELEKLMEMAALLEEAEEMQRRFAVHVTEMRWLYEVLRANTGITPIQDERQQVMH